MATEAIEQVSPPDATEGEATPAKKSGGNRIVLILAIAGLAAGAAAGLFGAGPVLAKRKATTHATPKVVDQLPASITHSVENIVLNPAGSNGQRFLMVTAAFEIKDASTLQLMKDHEPEIRDHILALLGKKTVEELTDMTQRARIKKDVLESVTPLFPQGSVLKVFFPQFVIQ